MYKKRDINRINEIILSTFKNIEKLILFGSYANGTAKEDSDIDFAIITQKRLKRIKKLQVLNQLWSNLAKEGYEVDLILKALENFESEKKIIGSLSYSVQKNGRILWEATSKTH